MVRETRWYDLITININWFALTARNQVLTALVIPLLVQQFVGEEAKGEYMGKLRLWALMAALLVQAMMGLLSDRSTSRWGRRRPFILMGTVGQVLVVAAIGYSAGLEGMHGYWSLFALYILSMFAADTAQSATQGLIPDLAPEDQRGRFSAVKTLLELPVPLVFTSFVVGKMVGSGNFWAALIALMVVLVICMLATMLVREKPLERAPDSIDWQPFLRLILMTAAFTLIILGAGEVVRLVIRNSADLHPSNGRLLIGTAGLLGMGFALGAGVWVSIRLGVGREIKRHASFVWWVILRLAFMIPITNLASFIIYFIQDRFPELGLERAAEPAAQAVMLVGCFIILFALPGGWLADRFGNKPLILISGLLGAFGTFVVVAAPDLALIYVGASMIGAAVGLFYSANWALGTNLVPPEQAGRYLGLSNLAGAGAGAIGAYIGGPIADQVGYVALFTIYGILFLFAVLPLMGIKEARAV